MLNAKKRMKDTQTYKNPIILLPISTAASFIALSATPAFFIYDELFIGEGRYLCARFHGADRHRRDGCLRTCMPSVAGWLVNLNLRATFTWQHFVCSRCLIGKADRHERPEAAASVKLLQGASVSTDRPDGSAFDHPVQVSAKAAARRRGGVRTCALPKHRIRT